MKMIAVVASAMLILMGFGRLGAQESQTGTQQPAVKKQTMCPVRGGAINTNLHVEYDGKRIYVCCQDCIETVKKDPPKYIRELEAGGVTLEKAQTTCPVMGGKLDKKVYADYDGKRVYFCCAGCIPQFKKDPGTYLKKLEADSSRRSALAEEEDVVPEPAPTAPDTEKKKAPKVEHKPGGGCH